MTRKAKPQTNTKHTAIDPARMVFTCSEGGVDGPDADKPHPWDLPVLVFIGDTPRDAEMFARGLHAAKHIEEAEDLLVYTGDMIGVAPNTAPNKDWGEPGESAYKLCRPPYYVEKPKKRR